MGKRKIPKPSPPLQVISAPERPPLIDPEEAAELKKLIQEINGPALAKRKAEAEAQRGPHQEHGPKLPPAA